MIDVVIAENYPTYSNLKLELMSDLCFVAETVMVEIPNWWAVNGGERAAVFVVIDVSHRRSMQ